MDIQAEHTIQIVRDHGYNVERIYAKLTPDEYSLVFKVKKEETEFHLTASNLECWASRGCSDADLQRLKIPGLFIAEL